MGGYQGVETQDMLPLGLFLGIRMLLLGFFFSLLQPLVQLCLFEHLVLSVQYCVMVSVEYCVLSVEYRGTRSYETRPLPRATIWP